MKKIGPLGMILLMMFIATEVSAKREGKRINDRVSSRDEGHGPSSKRLPSHRFQWEGRSYKPQFNIHFGLSQPLLLAGFNVAVDFRINRFVFEYSHGVGLQYHWIGLMSQSDLDAGMKLYSPWTTGFGLGFNLIDDLFVMVEFKAHRYDAIVDGVTKSYTTLSVGPAIGYRFFIWRGLNITLYLRYWPNVWSSEEAITFSNGSKEHRHTPKNLNFFANLSLGWAFDLVKK